MKQTIIFLTLFSTILCACQKKDNTTPDASKVVINVSSPSSGQVYHNGDSVHINATISYQSELHGYEVKITDTVTGNVIYNKAEHTHNDHFEINDAIQSTGSVPLYLKLEITTEIDHAGNDAERAVSFRYEP